MNKFAFCSEFPCSQEHLFEWHCRNGTLERLAPPFMPFKVISRSGYGLINGSTVTLEIPLIFGIKKLWEYEYLDCQPVSHFRTLQRRGLLSHWSHLCRIKESSSGAVLQDEIEFLLPSAKISNLFFAKEAIRRLRASFIYRHRIIKNDLEFIDKYRNTKRLKILISGGTGFIGQNLVAFLTTLGHEITILSRSSKQHGLAKIINWNPEQSSFHLPADSEFDAVINLCGENISSARWTPKQKKLLIQSRINTTKLLVEALSRLSNPPKHFLSASAIGYYGEQGDKEVCEDDRPKGSGFLAELCQKWEHEALQAEKLLGSRTVILRIGIVLSPAGGALRLISPIFKFGLGGCISSGKQWMSWVDINDLIYAITFILYHSSLDGPINITAPNPVINTQFTAILAKTLKRPALLTVPAKFLELALGQDLARETVLGSIRAIPRKLTDAGFSFFNPELYSALKMLYGHDTF